LFPRGGYRSRGRSRHSSTPLLSSASARDLTPHSPYSTNIVEELHLFFETKTVGEIPTALHFKTHMYKGIEILTERKRKEN
jgi:hypothetical protein